MKKQHGSTKNCKYCKTEIDYYAKRCPQCRKNQSGNWKFIVMGIIAFYALGVIYNLVSDDSDSSTSKNTEVSGKENVEDVKEYIPYVVSEMMSDLDSNALKAKDKYHKQYVEISGKLNVIDSNGKYISIVPDEDFAIIGVQCYIKDDMQKNKVMDMSIGDTVTLKGQVTDVGEVLGYSLDIDEID